MTAEGRLTQWAENSSEQSPKHKETREGDGRSVFWGAEVLEATCVKVADVQHRWSTCWFLPRAMEAPSGPSWPPSRMPFFLISGTSSPRCPTHWISPRKAGPGWRYWQRRLLRGQQRELACSSSFAALRSQDAGAAPTYYQFPGAAPGPPLTAEEAELRPERLTSPPQP